MNLSRFKKGNTLLFFVALTICAAFIVFLYQAWSAQINNVATCSILPDGFRPESASNLWYLELDLSEQDPVEPVFHGRLVLGVMNATSAPNNSVHVVVSAGRGYLSHSGSISFAPITANYPTLNFWGTDELALYPISRSHWYFPFDSATFDSEVTLTGHQISMLRIADRVPGFIMNCTGALDQITYDSNTMTEKHHIHFDLGRSPLVRLAALCLVAASVVFLGLILLVVKTENLPQVVASYFFSMWSIRTILTSQMRTFPTLLDCVILSLCMLLLVLLGLKFAIQKLSEARERASVE